MCVFLQAEIKVATNPSFKSGQSKGIKFNSLLYCLVVVEGRQFQQAMAAPYQFSACELCYR